MNTEEKKSRGKGFYIALAVCLTAITAAGFSTYKSIKDFPNPPKSEMSRKNSNVPIDKGPKVTNDINSKKSLKNNPSFPIKEESKKPKDKPQILENLAGDQEDNELQSVSTEQVDTLIIYPTDKTIIKEFSGGKPVYSKTLGDWRAHDGTDFKAGQGSMVKSISAGTVKDVYSDSAYGTTVVIDHNTGFTAYYCGLGATTLVQKGEEVKSGQDIGSINTVPIEIAEEPHLHLMIRKDDKFIDPILVLEQDKE